MAAHGTFGWRELMTNDVAKAKAFYGATLGWTFSDMPMQRSGVYTIAHSGQAMAAGIMDMTGVTPPGVPPHWFDYIEVDDVDHRVSAGRRKTAAKCCGRPSTFRTSAASRSLRTPPARRSA